MDTLTSCGPEQLLELLLGPSSAGCVRALTRGLPSVSVLALPVTFVPLLSSFSLSVCPVVLSVAQAVDTSRFWLRPPRPMEVPPSSAQGSPLGIVFSHLRQQTFSLNRPQERGENNWSYFWGCGARFAMVKRGAESDIANCCDSGVGYSRGTF